MNDPLFPFCGSDDVSQHSIYDSEEVIVSCLSVFSFISSVD